MTSGTLKFVFVFVWNSNKQKVKREEKNFVGLIDFCWNAEKNFRKRIEWIFTFEKIGFARNEKFLNLLKIGKVRLVIVNDDRRLIGRIPRKFFDNFNGAFDLSPRSWRNEKSKRILGEERRISFTSGHRSRSIENEDRFRKFFIFFRS